MAMRQPLIVCVGHVDAGKTLLLDKIRGTAVAAGEAGGITQNIGCSYVPLSTVRRITGELLNALKIEFTIPGLLFIDTPGHAAFTNLRKRGGNLADIAILVVDIIEGFKPQTIEAIEILKSFKTPFIVALNKVDKIPGWNSSNEFMLKDINSQSIAVQSALDTRLYDIVGKLSEMGFTSERFDRVEDFTKQIAIVPCSAKSAEGIPELLMVISGLAQKYLESRLDINVLGKAKGTVLEVKKDKGLGTTLDVIIYDGVLRRGDQIVIGGLNGPVVTRVKALFEPAPLSEMRVKSIFEPVSEVIAASGVKISAIGVDDVISGTPLRAADDAELEAMKEEVQAEVSEVLVETDKDGILVKADTLGSLEALLRLLKEKGISVRRASIGEVSRKDIQAAQAISERSALNAVILAFNVPIADAEIPKNVKVIPSQIIYALIEEIEKWQFEFKKNLESRQLDNLSRPAKIKVMPGYVFRQSNPAIVGVEILSGQLRTGMQLMKEGKIIGFVKGLQLEQESISSAEAGKQIAASIENATVGRQIMEGDVLLSVIPEEDYRKLKTLAKHLSKEEIAILKEIAELNRRDNPMWGI